jgi:hypothetical protein
MWHGQGGQVSGLLCRTLGCLLCAVLLTAGSAPKPSLPALPPSWHVTASALADVTGDGVAEWVLVVWRPWRDWPIQRWSSVASPIAAYRDAAGESCHLILLHPQDGREIWAGSALPVPFLALHAGDVDRDGTVEVVTVEGSYEGSRQGPGTHVDVWAWNGFGFALQWRSPLGVFDSVHLEDPDARAALLNAFVTPDRSSH